MENFLEKVTCHQQLERSERTEEGNRKEEKQDMSITKRRPASAHQRGVNTNALFRGLRQQRRERGKLSVTTASVTVTVGCGMPITNGGS